MTRKDFFKCFEEHTRLKHFLLDSYLKAWATILLTGGFERVWFVDAFAGAGYDEDGHPGSPVIAARIAREINDTHVPPGREDSRGMRVVAIELEPECHAALRESMREFTDERPRWAFVKQGTLDEHLLDRFLRHVGDDPVLFFLDPFGVGGLSAEVVSRAMAGEHNEALILFHDEGAVRLAAKADADPSEAHREFAQALQTRTLFGDEHIDHALAAEKLRRSLAGHKSNPNAAAILDTAYGYPEARELIIAASESERQQLAVMLYQQMLSNRCGALTLPFPIDTKDGRHKYYLVHASKNPSAVRAMKDAMYRTKRKREGELEPPAAELITAEFVLHSDMTEIVSTIAEHFAGRLVRWQGTPKGVPNVYDFAITETPLWMHEREALKQALIARGWDEKDGRALVFRFPESHPPNSEQ